MRNRLSGMSVVVAVALVSGAVLVRGGPNTFPALADFRDDALAPDRLQSDGKGSYDDGQAPPQCTISWTGQGGSYFLRTVKSGCTASDPRSIKLDFSVEADGTTPPSGPCSVSDPQGDLDRCGVNDVPDVRLLANALFKDNALTDGSTVRLLFSMKAGGDFVGTSSFELTFEQPVPVPSGDQSFRVLEAGANAVAELYQNVTQGKRTVKTSLGRYRMPFQLTVTK